MRCLVTGAFGFIGRNLVPELSACGISVVAVGPRIHSGCSWEGVSAAEASFTDVAAMGRALDGVDAVVHLARTIPPRMADNDVPRDIEENVAHVVRFAEQCASSGVSRFVNMSSGGAVYGDTNGSVSSESDPANPVGTYGISKLCVEKYLEDVTRRTGMSTCSIRASNVYGPYQPADYLHGVVAPFILGVARGDPITVWGDGSKVRDYIYVADLVRAVISALRKNGVTGPVNVGSGTSITLSGLVSEIEGCVGRKAVVRYCDTRSYGVKSSALDMSRAMGLLDWSPSFSIRGGISETARWQRGIGMW